MRSMIPTDPQRFTFCTPDSGVFMALLAFCCHGDQRTLNSSAVNGFSMIAGPFIAIVAFFFSFSFFSQNLGGFHLPYQYSLYQDSQYDSSYF
jgi:hypothetical protein